MKSIIVTLLFIAVVGIMISTNPTIDNYASFLRQEIVRGTKDEDDFSKGLALLFGGLAGSVLSNATTRKNYLLFSTYHMDLETKQIRCLGILGNFVNCASVGHRALKALDELTKQKVEPPKKLEAKAQPTETSSPEALPGINAGETIELKMGHRFLFTFTEWLESSTAVDGPYNPNFCTFTAKPDMKFVIVKYRVQNGWIEEQSTPYLNAGKLTTNKGYRYKVWSGGCSELNKPPHFVKYSTPGEIERYVGIGAGYKSSLLPEESRVDSIVFEIPKDQEPLEAHIVYIERTILLEKAASSSNKFRWVE